jgi:hypothetical protein
MPCSDSFWPSDRVGAIGKFIRDAKKIAVDEKEVFNPWPQ